MRQLKIQKSITNRNSEALDKYLVEIGRAPMVSIDEEIGYTFLNLKLSHPMLLTPIFNCVYIILRKYKKNIASLLFLLIYFNNIFLEKSIFFITRGLRLETNFLLRITSD